MAENSESAAPHAASRPAHASLRYALAAASVAAATLLMFGLYDVLGLPRGSVPFIFYFGAVIVSARFGGRGAGLVATALSAVVADYFFLPPFDAFALDRAAVLQLSVFGFVSLFITDLTGRAARARAVAHTSRESLATTLRSIGDGVIATDAEGRVTLMNAVAERLTGWTEREARGRRVEEVFRIVNELTRAGVESPVARVIREGSVVGLANHTVLISKSGAEAPIDDSGAPIKDREGRVIGVVMVFHDVSERRRSEAEAGATRARLSGVVESAMDAIITVDAEQRVVLFNRAAEKMFRCAAADALGQPLERFIPKRFRGEHRRHVEGFGRTGVTARAMAGSRAVAGLRADGEEFPLEASISQVEAGGQKLYTVIMRDITERVRAGEEGERLASLVEVERERLRNLVANVPGVVWEAWGVPDEEGQRIDFVSDYVERMLGYTVEEWLRTPNFWLSIVHPEDHERAAREAHEIFASGRGGVSRFRWVARDGRVVPVESQSVAIVDAAGRSVGMRGVTMDITERVRAEAELRASEERYRALADAMPQIVYTARGDGYIDYYNRRWFEYTGLTPEQSEGWGWQPVLHPEDVERSLRRWARALIAGEEHEIEYRFRRASDGQYRWHLGRAVPMRDHAGRIVRWFGTCTDIHDQKVVAGRSQFLAEAGALLSASLDYEKTLEALARLSVNSLADYCLIDLLDDGGRATRVATTHADPSLETLVARLREYSPDMQRGVGVAHVLQTGRPVIVPDVTEEVLREVTLDATHLRILRELGLKSYMTVPLVARGRTIGALTLALTSPARRYGDEDLAFAEQIAARAALAIDHARLYRGAREANRLKDEFLATLSHELRTPLTPILGWTHMLQTGRLPSDETAHGLGVIEANALALTRLINDLLDMSSVTSGKMAIVRAPVSLGETLGEAFETARPLAERLGVRLDLEASGDCGTVSGDRARLVQVFWNLLNNAVKFSRRGGRVRVVCANEDGAARITVEDEGAGIEPDFLPHVFERFRQADGSTTRAHGGLGIGLALVKSFTEAHGGTVTAESGGADRGARFTVTLPLLRTAETWRRGGGEKESVLSEVSPSPPHPVPLSQKSATSKGRVLIVEDSRDTLEMLKVALGARGYDVVICESAAEALRAAGTLWFDIVVSDIGLPQTDGYELIARLRALPHLADVAALALTGYASKQDEDRALAAGFDAHMAKPVNPEALAAAVGRLVAEKSHRRAGAPEP